MSLSATRVSGSSGSGSGSGGGGGGKQDFIAIAGQNKFTVTNFIITDGAKLLVFINQGLITDNPAGTLYVVSGQDVTFTWSMLGDEVITIKQ